MERVNKRGGTAMSIWDKLADATAELMRGSPIAAVLGGVSLFGGRGSAFPGAFLGVLIIMTIENGLVMAQANMYAYTIVRGIIIFIAVFLDSAQNRGEMR